METRACKKWVPGGEGQGKVGEGRGEDGGRWPGLVLPRCNWPGVRPPFQQGTMRSWFQQGFFPTDEEFQVRPASWSHYVALRVIYPEANSAFVAPPRQVPEEPTSRLDGQCPTTGWQYIGPNGVIQGPFTLREMQLWYSMGYFRA